MNRNEKRCRFCCILTTRPLINWPLTTLRFHILPVSPLLLIHWSPLLFLEYAKHIPFSQLWPFCFLSKISAWLAPSLHDDFCSFEWPLLTTSSEPAGPLTLSPYFTLFLFIAFYHFTQKVLHQSSFLLLRNRKIPYM